MRGWPLDELPKHILEWRANLPLPAVARWSEDYGDGERRRLENARKAASWDAAAICEMRSKMHMGFVRVLRGTLMRLCCAFGSAVGGKRRKFFKKWSRGREAVLSA